MECVNWCELYLLIAKCYMCSLYLPIQLFQQIRLVFHSKFYYPILSFQFCINVFNKNQPKWTLFFLSWCLFLVSFQNNKIGNSNPYNTCASKRLLPIVRELFLDRGSLSFILLLSRQVQPSLNKKKFQSLEEFLTKKVPFSA